MIQKWLETKGFVVYKPITFAAHAFDKLAIKDKKQAIIVETKSKAARKYYPDTGINVKHYREYKFISKKHRLPVFIFFVDENVGKIYGNWLSILEKEEIIIHNGKTLIYPLVDRGIIYFPLEKMRFIAMLDLETIEKLKYHSTRNYKY